MRAACLLSRLSTYRITIHRTNSSGAKRISIFFSVCFPLRNNRTSAIPLFRAIAMHQLYSFPLSPSKTLIDRVNPNQAGGLFHSFFAVDMMRAISYRYAGITTRTRSYSQLRLMILGRKRSRWWVDLPRYIRAIERVFGNVWLFLLL